MGRRIGAYFLAIPLAIVTLGIGYASGGWWVWGRGQTRPSRSSACGSGGPSTGRVAGCMWMALPEVVGRLAEGILSIITLLVSFILMVTSKQHQSLHDLIAGTVVLHDPNKVLAG